MRRMCVKRCRLGVSFLLGLLALLVTIAPASAGVGWCRADPVVMLNGAPLQIWVSIPKVYQPYVNGPIDVEISVPREVAERQVVYTDLGFNGHGEQVRWRNSRDSIASDGTIPVTVTVKVKFDKKGLRAAFGKGVEVPVRVEVIQDGTSQWFEGTHTDTNFSVTVTAASEHVD